MRSRSRWFSSVVTALLLAAIPLIAAAWPRAALAQAAPAGRVEIKVEQFGLGNTTRPGSYAGFRVNVAYSGAEARAARVSWAAPDADGDIALYSREVTLNPGARNPVWLYVPLSWHIDGNQAWVITVNELDEDGRVGAEIGATRIRLPQIMERDDGAIGIIGLRDANLRRYGAESMRTQQPIAAHERTRIISALEPAELPDRWMGFDIVDALIWTPEADPGALGLESARAIREWVHRGGHLVIILPEVAMPWSGTPLDLVLPLSPDVLVRKWENVELRNNDSGGGLLRHLGRENEIEPQDRHPPYPLLTLTLMRPVDGRTWADTGLVPLMEIEAAEPDGTNAATAPYAIAAQAVMGFGRVTLLGAPVTSPQLNRPGLELPQAEVFWNQILGRREDTPSPEEIDRLRQISAFNARPLAKNVHEQIRLSPQASRGLLLALFFFAAYWVISGPGVFALLKQRGLVRHSWLAFVLIAIAFTAIGWTTARTFRSNDIRPVHLTIVDHVANGEWRRATSFLTVALDGYGQQPVEVGREGVEKPWHDVVHTFTTPYLQTAAFPDRRQYVVDAEDQSSVGFPARSTAKQFTVRWLGPPDEEWGMPNYASASQRPQLIDGNLHGSIYHDLPGTLRHVTVIWADNRWYATEERGAYLGLETRREDDWHGVPRLRVWASKFSEWAPGEVNALALNTLTASRFTQFGETLVRDTSPLGDLLNYSGGASDLRTLRTALEAASFYHQLTPPRWNAERIGSGEDQPRLQRTLGRDLDLSAWLVRPCLIIIGYLEDGPIGAPITVGGERLDEAQPGSLTMIRWIYPLPAESEPRGD